MNNIYNSLSLLKQSFTIFAVTGACFPVNAGRVREDEFELVPLSNAVVQQ